jgi:hypothetical protein
MLRPDERLLPIADTPASTTSDVLFISKAARGDNEFALRLAPHLYRFLEGIIKLLDTLKRQGIKPDPAHVSD